MTTEAALEADEELFMVVRRVDGVDVFFQRVLKSEHFFGCVLLQRLDPVGLLFSQIVQIDKDAEPFGFDHIPHTAMVDALVLIVVQEVEVFPLDLLQMLVHISVHHFDESSTISEHKADGWDTC